MSIILKDDPIPNPDDVPKEMDIFYNNTDEIPDGLSEEELKRRMNQYRFAPYKPGIYQAITGLRDSTGY